MGTGISDSNFDATVDAMRARVDRDELPGLVILVARGDDVRVQALGGRAFGGADGPMRRDTVFRIASLTKPILAAATMILVEEGLLNLAEPVDRLLPELADRRVLRAVDGPLDDTVPAQRRITVDDLLTFRFGFGQITEPTFDPPYPIVRAVNDLELVMGAPDPRTPHDPDTWLRHFATLPLMYQPGERWQYNAGSLVLGVLVARAAGQSLGDVFASRIFTPLGLTDTGFWRPMAGEDGPRGLPRQYLTNVSTGVMEEQTLTGPELWSRPPVFPSGAGGLLSTVDDYCTFAQVLLHKGWSGDGRQLLSAESVQQMTTNRLTPEQVARGGMILDGSGWGYGMGVVIKTDDVASAPGAYGWSGGSGTGWFNAPGSGLTAIVMSQTSDFLFNGALTEFRTLASRC